MIQATLERIRLALSSQFAVNLRGTRARGSAGSAVRFTLDGIRPQEGFSVRVESGWRSVRATLELGNFAGELLDLMRTAEDKERLDFAAWFSLGAKSGRRVAFVVDGAPADPRDSSVWERNWQSLKLSISRIGVEPDSDSNEEEEARAQAALLIGMVLSLLGGEEEGELVEGELEGDRSRIEVNRYERSRLNRALCIEALGVRCNICGFDFETVYGEVGSGFIHVHHVTPVSRLGPGYRIDPVVDLIPVCANCHAMLHRRNPPLLPSELRTVIQLPSLQTPHELNANMIAEEAAEPPNEVD